MAPRFGGRLVAGWLAGIIVSLLLVAGYGDIALRDFGLLLGALTLARLAGANFSFPASASAHAVGRPASVDWIGFGCTPT